MQLACWHNAVRGQLQQHIYEQILPPLRPLRLIEAQNGHVADPLEGGRPADLPVRFSEGIVSPYKPSWPSLRLLPREPEAHAGERGTRVVRRRGITCRWLW